MSKSISWDGEYFILTAGSDACSNTFTYAYSSDGINWNKTAFPPNVSAQTPYSAKNLGDNYEIVGNLTSTSTTANGNVLTRPCTVNVVDGAYPVTLENNLANETVIYDVECNLEQPNRIVFPKSVTLALGTTSKIAYSLDQGKSWTASSGSVFTTLANDAVWNGQVWVAGGTGGNTIATSLDGVTWTGRGNYIFSTSCRGIDWSQSQNKFIAVGNGTYTMATSFDGIYWLGANTNLFAIGYDVKFNGSLWVAVGTPRGGNGTIAYSPDGITWTYASQSFATAGRRIYYDGTVWTVFGQDPLYNFATSSDGMTWILSTVSGATELKMNFPTGQFPDATINMYPGIPYPIKTVSTAIIATVNRYVHNNSDKGCVSIQPISIACGEGQTSLAYSIDGIHWTAINNSLFTRANKAVWNGSLWVAVGMGSYCIATSYDGINWTGINSALFTECYDVAWNGSWFVAVGKGNARIANSSNGIIWTAVSNTIITTQVHAIEWTGMVWMAYGSGTNTTAISSSIDGSVWTATTSASLCTTDGSNIVVGNLTNATASSTGNGSSVNNLFDGQFNANPTKWVSVSGKYFNGDYTGPEITNGNAGEWVQVRLTNPKICRSYYLIFSTNSGAYIPKTWRLFGSTNGTTWISLGLGGFYSNTTLPNNYWKYQYITVFTTITNVSLYSYYRIVFLTSFGGDSVDVSEFGLIDNSRTLSRYIRPIVLRDCILHPFRLFPTDGVNLNAYRITDLTGSLVGNIFIHNQYVNPAIYGLTSEPTACSFDGMNHIVCSASGEISYLSNSAALTNLNFDNVLNGVAINSGIAGASINAACYNRKYLLVGGAGGAITYGSLASSNLAPTFYPTNASSLFTTVYGLASNSGYGVVSSPNVLHLKEDDKLSVITPKFYDGALSPDTSISFNVYKSVA